MPDTYVTLSISDDSAELLINRPAKRNALTRAMWRQLGAAIDTVARTPSVRLLTLRGAGGVFSAGADLEELGEIIGDPAALAANNALVRDAQIGLERLACLSVAVVEGACVGGGCGLALACDFRLALPDAQFAITPARLGLLYSVEDVRRVVNLVGPARARQLLLTAQKVSAATALEWGMLTEICAPDALAARLAAWRTLAGQVSPYSISGIKRSIGMLTGAEPADFAAQQRLFDQAFTHADFTEGARAFLEKRAPRF